jgi:hypothetical protein
VSRVVGIGVMASLSVVGIFKVGICFGFVSLLYRHTFFLVYTGVETYMGIWYRERVCERECV